ncbi:MAG TPA: S41 family peptidase [Candidatus Baltobacteraceae bacterium]|nr:S41 family peptidase [Candidatus Baltobacteraceae bacterium]
MSSRIRWLFAAVVLIVAAFAGALYVHSFQGPGASPVSTADEDADEGKVASIDVGAVLGPQVVDQQLLGLAYRQVERVYYKPVDAQMLVDGEHAGLQAYLRAALKEKHVTLTPSLPVPQSAGDAVQDVHALDHQLAYAQDHYAQYLGRDGRTKLTQAALAGMLQSLHDPYTVYLAPEQIRALNEELNGGNFGGIGVFIYQLKDGQVIVQPIEGLPAARAGMHADEVVQNINGQPVHGMALDKVERLIRGPQGTVVTLTTHPYKKTAEREYRITREIIHVPTVHAKVEDGYDYIRLSDFGETSAAEVRKALIDGKAHGAKATILDLRNNGGGLLNAAVDISSLFIQKGAIVTEIDRYGNRDTQYATGNVLHGVTPLVVLVNGYTASASEITSGALQDYKLATLIGTKTFGKGVVQGIFSMPNGGALKITTQRYVTPNGRDIQHKGIQPDIVIPQSLDLSYVDTPKDKQLAAAKAYLKRLTR